MAGGFMAQSSPLICTSILCIGIFVYAAVQLAAFSPLYTPMECHKLDSGLGEPKVDFPWINITGAMKKECQNPNPYAIRISQRIPGQVFIKNGTDLLPVGQVHVPDTEFPAHGKGVGESEMEIAVPISEASALTGKPVIQVVSEVHVRSQASPRFFGVPMSATEDKDEVCGFEVRVATRKVGPSRCAQTLEELVIPDVDAEPRASFVHLDKERLAKQELKKNVAFGSVLAISFLGAAASIAVGVCRVRAQGKARDAKLHFKASEDNDECEGEAVQAGAVV